MLARVFCPSTPWHPARTRARGCMRTFSTQHSDSRMTALTGSTKSGMAVWAEYAAWRSRTSCGGWSGPLRAGF